MKEVTEEEVLNNLIYYKRCCLVLGIYLKKNITTLSKIARELGDNVSSSNLRVVIKFLEENKFLSVDKSRIPYLYIINGSELGWFIRKSKYFKICADNPIKSSMGIKPYYYG